MTAPTGNPMHRIGASSYNVFRTCPRLFYWQILMRLRLAREEGARRFGTMYHAGLEEWWRAMDGDDPWKDPDAALVHALMGIANNARPINTDPFDVARAEAMMVGYHSRYYELAFETVDGAGDGVEVYFDLPLLSPDGKPLEDWRISGRKDAIKRFRDGRVKAVEHKHSSSEIHGASDYWARLIIDIQCSIYIDAAQRMGHETDEVLYDVSRKPDIKPLLATPEDKRKFTKGKGCKYCGGRAGGKGGVAAGTGRIMVRTAVDGDGNKLPAPIDVEVTCTHCKGTGWEEAPALYEKQRTEDESVEVFRARIHNEIALDPDAHYRMASVRRTPDQIAEARHDIMITTGEIGALIHLGINATPSGKLSEPAARRCFPRNGQACTSIYGRRCDFLDVCAGAVDPFESQLYQVGRTKAAT